jgi:DNA-binding MarR family transcriptional regulator
MRPVHEIENSLGFLLHNASRAIKRRFETRASEVGLTSAQWRVLVQLLINGGLPQARLAEALEIEPISVSRIVDRMEQGGWVTRAADPNDRRIRIICHTAKAQSVFDDARMMADSIYAQAFKGLPLDAQNTLIATLQTIITNLGQAPSEPSHDE